MIGYISQTMAINLILILILHVNPHMNWQYPTCSDEVVFFKVVSQETHKQVCFSCKKVCNCVCVMEIRDGNEQIRRTYTVRLTYRHRNTTQYNAPDKRTLLDKYLPSTSEYQLLSIFYCPKVFLHHVLLQQTTSNLCAEQLRSTL